MLPILNQHPRMSARRTDTASYMDRILMYRLMSGAAVTSSAIKPIAANVQIVFCMRLNLQG